MTNIYITKYFVFQTKLKNFTGTLGILGFRLLRGDNNIKYWITHENPSHSISKHLSSFRLPLTNYLFYYLCIFKWKITLRTLQTLGLKSTSVFKNKQYMKNKNKYIFQCYTVMLSERISCSHSTVLVRQLLRRWLYTLEKIQTKIIEKNQPC